MNAAQLAKSLGAVRSGRQWKCCCVAHEDASPSMIIFDGRDQVQVRCMAGCDPRDIISVLDAGVLWCATPSNDVQQQGKSVSRETQNDRREQRMRILARGIFDEAVACKGTLAQRYFESRDLWVVAREIDDIRFHLTCPRESGEHPAVVVAMRSITSNAITGIQRIFIDRDAKKTGKGMMLGTVSGAAMKLQPLLSRHLHVAEGLETGLAVIAMDHGPTWSMGSTSLIAMLPVIDGINRLTIHADHDRINPTTGKRPGHQAAATCLTRWSQARREVDVVIPKIEGHDEADVWSARCERV